MVRGVEPVALRLRELIGFGYPELVESFYLAQREISTPKPHSDAVRAMAGIDALERVAAECRRERDQTESLRAEATRAQADIAAQVRALGHDPQHLIALEAEQARTQAALAGDRGQIQAIKAAAEAADGALSRVKEGAATWLAVEPRASLVERQGQATGLAGLLDAVAPTRATDEGAGHAYATLSAAARAMDERLAAFAALRRQALAYRDELAARLAPALIEHPAEGPAEPPIVHSPRGDKPFATQLAGLDRRIHKARRRRLHSRAWGLTAALLGLGLAMTWGLLVQAQPGEAAIRIAAALNGLVPGWRSAIRLERRTSSL
jgi:hypothetical protein